MLNTDPNASGWPPAMPQPREIKALLLDDSNFDRTRIRRLSDKTNLMIQMDEVESLEQMEKAVAREHYDVVLIDYRLPQGDGMDALDMIRDNDLNKGAGKVMITGDSGRDTVVNAMRGGCHDFLTKAEMDVAALRGAIMTAMQAAWQNQQVEQLAQMQKDVIRQGLVEAIRDSEVQGNMMSMMRDQMRNLEPPGARSPGVPALPGATPQAPDDLDALLSYLDEDEFVFH